MKMTLGDLVPRSIIQRANDRMIAKAKARMKTQPLSRSFELMGIGAAVIDSPGGPGKVTGFSNDGLPRVRNHAGNDVARWCVFAYGPSLRVFDPFKEAPEEYRR